MTPPISPANEKETAEAVAEAHATHRPFAIEGGGTRTGLGRPVEAEASLSTRKLTGITLYEPAELVISARAGTQLAEIEATLATSGQRLAFEPMDHRRIYGTECAPTIGAIAACNISGPRRINGGAARDHLIGLRLVNGRGEIVKTGGRVMKNVTGLDLVKLSCGAHGTLGVLTEVTFKVLPRAERTGTLAIAGLDDANGVAALNTALGSPYQILGAAHLPADLAGTEALTLLRIEGPQAGIVYRLGALQTLLRPYGSAEILDEKRASDLWCDIRDAACLAEPRDAAMWRLSVAPTRGPAIVEAIGNTLEVRHFYDLGGGLIWLVTAPAGDAGAAAIRAALAGVGGHATLIRASDSLRKEVPVFEPLSDPLMKITTGIKLSFDPDRILNPGRMYPGL
jgi:glycolate oxidase FAD binding subunit